jgi:phenylpyruvate tautomerase PptA (4-oxalocrotonate tautomerase family)
MATKKNALPFLPAQEYDAKPDEESTADTRAMLKKRLTSIHANMMDGDPALTKTLMDDVDRKDWPEGEEL